MDETERLARLVEKHTKSILDLHASTQDLMRRHIATTAAIQSLLLAHSNPGLLRTVLEPFLEESTQVGREIGDREASEIEKIGRSYLESVSRSEQSLTATAMIGGVLSALMVAVDTICITLPEARRDYVVRALREEAADAFNEVKTPQDRATATYIAAIAETVADNVDGARELIRTYEPLKR